MMPYLNLDLDFFSHPKIVRLSAILGADASMYPIKLWVWVAKYHCQDGMLQGYSKHELESMIGWTGEKGVLFDAMLKVNLIGENENGYVIHDWLDHAGHLSAFKKRAKTAAKRRWKKYATSIAKTKTTNAPNLPILTNHTKPNQVEEKTPIKADDNDWLSSLKENPAYAHINLPVELGKMDAWLALPKNRHRKKTRAFVLNWLNKIEQPLNGSNGHASHAPIPPFPGAEDPIGRSLWRKSYGDPANPRRL